MCNFIDLFILIILIFDLSLFIYLIAFLFLFNNLFCKNNSIIEYYKNYDLYLYKSRSINSL